MDFSRRSFLATLLAGSACVVFLPLQVRQSKGPTYRVSNASGKVIAEGEAKIGKDGAAVFPSEVISDGEWYHVQIKYPDGMSVSSNVKNTSSQKLVADLAVWDQRAIRFG